MPEGLPEAPRRLLVWSESASDSDAEKLARRLGVHWEVSAAPPAAAEWVLFFGGEGLCLQSGKHPEFRPLHIDYLGGDFARRWRSATKNDILVKAIGLKKGVRTVCDASCGLGYDAFFLSTFKDMEVTACERHPVAAELVMDALDRVKETGRFEKNPLYFHFGDARDFLAARPGGFDAVFLDPMFPRPEGRTALPRKEMLLFGELVGRDEDAGSLFEAAWGAAKKRVVVKRSDDASELLSSRAPDFTIAGTTVRFDIYTKSL